MALPSTSYGASLRVMKCDLISAHPMAGVRALEAVTFMHIQPNENGIPIRGSKGISLKMKHADSI